MKYILAVLACLFLAGCSRADDSYISDDLKIINACIDRLKAEGSKLVQENPNRIHEEFHGVRIMRNSLSDYISVQFGITPENFDPTLISDSRPVLCWIELKNASVIIKSLSAPEGVDDIFAKKYLQFTDKEMQDRRRKINEGIASSLVDSIIENVYWLNNGVWLPQ